jgi:cytochrome b subunit of formate dehydrogenase
MEKYLNISILIITYFIFHSILSNNVQKTGDEYYSNREKNNKTRHKVYDIMHKNLPENEDLNWMTNVIVIISLIPLIKENNNQLYFDFIILLILINFIRDITINLTILPKNKTCNLNKYNDLQTNLVGACYDKIFSGHFAFVFLLSLIYYSNSIITNIPLLIGWNLFNALIILIVRSHYTIDIVVSFFVCSFVFTKYSNMDHSIDNILNSINS